MDEFENKTIDWDKDTYSDNDNYSDEELKHKQNKVEDLCKLLSQNKENFNETDFLRSLYDYLKVEDRLLYSSISNFIFANQNNNEICDKVQINVESLLSYLKKNDIQEIIEDDNPNSSAVLKKTVFKIWDHINLATKQYSVFSSVDIKYQEIVDTRTKEVEAKITKNLTAQLISLIGIFTALSFLIFGGISSFDSILTGAIKEISIIKLIILATIWSIAMLNLVFIFMIFVAKITSLEKNYESEEPQIIKKYPLVIWTNTTLLTVLVIGIWTYLIDYSNSGAAILNFVSSGLVSIVGYVVILLFFIGFNILYFSKLIKK